MLSAVFATSADDDLVRALARSDAVASLLGEDDGKNLLSAYKRASNILRIEEKRDGPHDGDVQVALLHEPEERELQSALLRTDSSDKDLAAEEFYQAMTLLSQLRPPLDAFFEKVTVNAEQEDLRKNRLRLLSSTRAALNRVADFSAIEA